MKNTTTKRAMKAGDEIVQLSNDKRMRASLVRPCPDDCYECGDHCHICNRPSTFDANGNSVCVRGCSNDSDNE